MKELLILIFFVLFNGLGMASADSNLSFKDVSLNISPKPEIALIARGELKKLIADKQYESQMRLIQMLEIKNVQADQRVRSRLIKSIPILPLDLPHAFKDSTWIEIADLSAS